MARAGCHGREDARTQAARRGRRELWRGEGYMGDELESRIEGAWGAATNTKRLLGRPQGNPTTIDDS